VLTLQDYSDQRVLHGQHGEMAGTRLGLQWHLSVYNVAGASERRPAGNRGGPYRLAEPGCRDHLRPARPGPATGQVLL